jgi:hypothetical protein
MLKWDSFRNLKLMIVSWDFLSCYTNLFVLGSRVFHFCTIMGTLQRTHIELAQSVAEVENKVRIHTYMTRSMENILICTVDP